jgi:predicted MPP superfamily phosphohydrolase
MIARAPYLFLLLVILPDVYFDLHYWRHRFTATRRIAYWIPTAILVGLTLKLTYEPEFIPDNTTLLYTYLLMIGLITAPKWAYVLCSAIGLATSKLVRLIKGKHRRKKPKNYGNLVGAIATVLIWYVVLYGAYIGFEKLEINHQTYSSPELPKEFDGYKIVLFSDAHVGTLKGDRQWMLKRAVDTMNAQNADMIIFTGDLQNVKPQEIVEHTELLGSLKAKDGVYSILGNHDYDKYMRPTEERDPLPCKETVALEKRMGWYLLMNEHKTIRRGKSEITIAGMEDDSNRRGYPYHGDVKKAIGNAKGFIIMLQHDPAIWRVMILPDKRAQLTLSGHTHNMQFSLFGWSPMSLRCKENYGWFKEGNQSLFVTAGLGGLIPWRFGATGEIVVLELKSVR